MSSQPLPRSSPGAQEVSARAVAAFLDGVDASGFELHSLMVVRHGQVITEGWWAPYRADGLHLLYSVSKSFTATAIGIAQAEGLLSVEDQVIDLLPAALPGRVDDHLRSLRVRHLLTMATGHRGDTLDWLGREDPVAAVLARPAEEPPGTWFTYNNGATLLLSAILTTLTGQRLLDYLRPRLLQPLGIDQANWRGAGRLDQGFSGLHLTTESVAKLGLLYLQGGGWAGRRLLPEDWVREATRAQVDNPREPEIDWRQGYGYQFWRCRHNAYRADGAFGQFCLVLPEQDAVVVTTAATENMQGLLDLVWAHLLPGFGRPDSVAEDERLADRLTRLTLSPVGLAGTPAEPAAVTLDTVEDTADGWLLHLDSAGTRLAVPCGDRAWAEIALPVGLELVLDVAARAAWEGDTLRAEVVAVRTPHRLAIDYSPTSGRSGVAWNVAPLGGNDLTHLALDVTRG